MEVVLLASGLNTLLPRLWDKREAANDRRTAIDINIQAISSGSNRLEAALEEAKFKGDGTGSALKCEAREVSQNTRDCIQLFFKNKKADSKMFEKNIEEYKKQVEALCDRLDKHSSSGETASQKPPDPHVAKPMGLDEPRDELLELVTLPGSRPSDGRRKVISVVGFGGLGKTLLAKLVYNDMSDYALRVRVTAAAKGADEVLREILKEVPPEEQEHENHKLEKLNLENLAQLLAKRLRGKRYLIVIDDMRSMGQWNGMNDAFPTDGDGDGTIIVTTTIQSVANVCSSCNGYVYKLSPLDKNKSIDLFLDRTLWNRCLMEDNAKDILKKCDGLPLAIVSMSQVLQGRGRPTSGACKAACKQLGTDLVNEGGDLERLRWVLMNKYTGLTGDPLRCCLLYFCMYKHNMDAAVPRKNSMIRRWEAEGFLVERNGSRLPVEVAAGNLETLVDRNIVESMEVGIDGATRRCRPPGMMVEYISQISKSENFAALVSDVVNPRDSRIRRLSFRAGSAADDWKILGMDLSIVLTLAVSGDGCQAILNFKKYELIAVLDLKECTNLDDNHVKYICKLLLLKYLSLGKRIGRIPREIGDLKLLETLEMRTTERVVVYAEVLELPNLKHLHGKFQLDDNPDKRLYDFLKKKSVLETITAYVSTTARGFPDLMLHMWKLRKVKIFCTSEASATDKQVLKTAIKEFILRGTDAFFSSEKKGTNFYSLSIDFTNNITTPEPESAPLLEVLQCPGSLTLLKWRGPFLRLGGRPSPHFTEISGITKLCLSHTYLRGEAILAGLTNLIALEYLKLDERDLGALLIKSGTFQMLTRLCLVGETKPHGITIQPKALPALVSLHLICKAPIFKVEDKQAQLLNGCLESLQEIALDSGVEPGMKIAWKNAAKGHPNRPAVLLIQKDARIRSA